MANRTKEEERLLDEKIARIQKKNEEILKREKEIEEDKRLAAKHNAIVQLRPSSTLDSRERTPALRPSKRESSSYIQLEAGDSAEASSNYAQNIGHRGKEGRRGRDRGDRIDGGPPPDPRSYLADAERDPIPPARDGRGDEFRNNRGMRGDVRGSSRGRFQRGPRRGRGKSEYGRGRDEDAWRAERNRIDEERIQRQKSSDGSWRREWDNEKIEQEFDDERYGGNRSGPNSLPDRWKSNYSQQSNQRIGNFEFDRSNRGSHVGKSSNRGRLDNQDHQHLEKNISPPTKEHFQGKSRHVSDDHFAASSRHPEEPILFKQMSNHIEPEKTLFKEDSGTKRTIDNEIPKTVLKYPPTSPRSVIDVGGSFKISVSNTKKIVSPSKRENYQGKSLHDPNNHFATYTRNLEEPILIRRIVNNIEPEKTLFKENSEIKRAIDDKMPETFPTSTRSVTDVGGSFKISVSNTGVASESTPISSKTPRRPNQDFRHRHKSQTSYSSQSEDEAHSLPPKERSYHGGRNKGLVFTSNKGHSKHTAQRVKEGSTKFNTADISNKPPLPLIKNNQAYEVATQDERKGVEDGEESWEDVTTSGTESIGEDIRSLHSSPNSILNTPTVSKSTNENILMEDIYTPEDFLIMQSYEDTSMEKSHEFYSENNKVNSYSSENYVEDTKQIIEGENIDGNECNKEQIEYIINKDTTEEDIEKLEENPLNSEKPLMNSDEVAEVQINEVTLSNVSDGNKNRFEYKENIGEHSSIKEMEKSTDISKEVEKDEVKTKINAILSIQNSDNEKGKETDGIQSFINNKECEIKEDN